MKTTLKALGILFAFFLIASCSEPPPNTSVVEMDATTENGIEVHSLTSYISNGNILPPDGFEDNLEYFYYNKLLGTIQGNLGGRSPGYLLHGEDKKSYRSTGNIYTSGNYYYGLLDGIYTVWNENGEIVLKEEWDKGKFIKTIIDNTTK